MLLDYALADPEIGYVQGMNFIAAAIVYHARCPSNSLSIFSFLMVQCDFRRLFTHNLSFSRLLSEQCHQRLKNLSFDLY